VKYFRSLKLLATLAACTSEADQPTQHIYRYPEGTPAAKVYQPGGHIQGSGLVVDYRNHALSEPKETQRWLLEPDAFLLSPRMAPSYPWSRHVTRAWQTGKPLHRMSVQM